MNQILPLIKHAAVTTKEIEEEHREEVAETYVVKPGEEIIEEEGKKYRLRKTKKTVT